MKIRYVLTAACAALAMAMASGPAMSAAEPEPDEVLSRNNPEFAEGQRAIAAKNWDGAIKSLLAADKRTSNNAYIHNLLGFAYRNAGQLDTSLKHYQRALQIDPRHRGAHEYIGEAYLMMNNPAKAEEHLAKLKSICPIVCEERDDLSKKIAAYKAR